MTPHRLAVITAVAALFAAGATHADPLTTSSTGILPFTGYPGYGIEYTATVEASAGSFVFSPQVSGGFNRLSVGGVFLLEARPGRGEAVASSVR